MPWLRYITARDLARPTTPCFEAVYAAPPALPRTPASETVFTIAPFPASAAEVRAERGQGQACSDFRWSQTFR